MIRAATLLIPLMIASAAYAETTKYVTDRLEIPMRTGKTTGHKVTKMLPSGMPLTVLQEDKEAGYMQVRTPTNAEGWVLSRYLLDEPAARDQLVKAQETIQQLRATDNTRDRLVTLTGVNQALEEEKRKLIAEKEQLQKEIERIRQVSANAINLDEENKKVTSHLLAMERDHQLLQQQTEALKDRRDRDWFIAGAGVLVLGMFAGIIIPKLRWRKKTSWGSL